MKIVALAGGVGGAKMSHGLAAVLKPSELSVIVNTGDDFKHYGLYISPDIDTVCYTLADLVNPTRGWGLKNDTFRMLGHLTELGGPDWFAIGDQDFCTHLERTRRMECGHDLTKITADFCRQWGVRPQILPMTNQKVSTIMDTIEYGKLPFQEYFVKHRFEPGVKGIHFEGLEDAEPTPQVLDAIKNCDAVVICPSNPFLSIDPIIWLNGISEFLINKYVLCVSPIIQNKCVKGPLSKMLVEMGYASDQQSILDHYREYLNCYVYDKKDLKTAKDMPASGIMTYATDILLPDLDSRARLATEIIGILRKALKK